jgi:hypothetical protein
MSITTALNRAKCLADAISGWQLKLGKDMADFVQLAIVAKSPKSQRIALLTSCITAQFLLDL